MTTFYGILIPFLGTTLGAACVFFLRRALGDRLQRALTALPPGVMVAASVWSLLIPAIDQSAALGRLSFLPAAVGFWIGVAFLLLLDRVIPHLHRNAGQAEGPRTQLQRTTMMILAVTLHNIPRGCRRRRLRRISDRSGPDLGRRSAGALARHRHPEFSGGRHHLSAAAR